MAQSDEHEAFLSDLDAELFGDMNTFVAKSGAKRKVANWRVTATQAVAEPKVKASGSPGALVVSDSALGVYKAANTSHRGVLTVMDMKSRGVNMIDSYNHYGPGDPVVRDGAFFNPGSGVEYTQELEKKRKEHLGPRGKRVQQPPSQQNLSQAPWCARFPELYETWKAQKAELAWLQKVFAEVFDAGERHVQDDPGAAFFFTLPAEIRRVIGAEATDRMLYRLGMTPIDDCEFRRGKAGLLSEFWVPWADSLAPLHQKCEAILIEIYNDKEQVLKNNINARRVPRPPQDDEAPPLKQVNAAPSGPTHNQYGLPPAPAALIEAQVLAAGRLVPALPKSPAPPSGPKTFAPAPPKASAPSAAPRPAPGPKAAAPAPPMQAAPLRSPFAQGEALKCLLRVDTDPAKKGLAFMRHLTAMPALAAPAAAGKHGLALLNSVKDPSCWRVSLLEQSATVRAEPKATTFAPEIGATSATEGPKAAPAVPPAMGQFDGVNMAVQSVAMPGLRRLTTEAATKGLAVPMLTALLDSVDHYPGLKVLASTARRVSTGGQPSTTGAALPGPESITDAYPYLKQIIQATSNLGLGFLAGAIQKDRSGSPTAGLSKVFEATGFRALPLLARAMEASQ